ncbi:MAG TPA: SH3 domain-containing protein [Gemmatimonadales bacterium]|nr:SH3 domain-containing protein [Gemmatimonadales bacterium]
MASSVFGPPRRSGTSSRLWHLACASLLVAITIPLTGCSARQPESAAAPMSAVRRQARAAAAVRAEQDRRISRLELALLEKTAQVEELQAQVDAAREEVVRAMAKLQTLASRAEAASGIAEAEVALQPLRARKAQQNAPEATQGLRLLREAAAEFNDGNYGGALYLANQVKALAALGTGRLSSIERTSEPRGEKPFAIPIPLKAVGSGNVREAPKSSAPIAFSVQGGDSLIGYSYVEDWVRISDDMGRGGWIFRKLIARR